MKITALTCTNGRFAYVSRLLGFFNAQEYNEKHLIIYNNAPVPININPIENVTLINNNLDYATQQPYLHVGRIYRDALTHIPSDTDFVSIMDDDDIYFPNHFAKGISSLTRNSSMKVWRPGTFYLKIGKIHIKLEESVRFNLESSCIIRHDFLRKVGFGTEGDMQTYNLTWLEEAKLKNTLFTDPNTNFPSFCYEIGQNNIFHMTGFWKENPQATKQDLDDYMREKADYGNGETLVPWSPEQTNKYYDYILKIASMYKTAIQYPVSGSKM